MIPICKHYTIEFSFKKKTIISVFTEGTFGEVLDFQHSLSSTEKIIKKSYEIISQKKNIQLEEFMNTHPEKLIKLCEYILKKWSGGFYTFSRSGGKAKYPDSSWIQIFLKDTSHSLEEMKQLRFSDIDFLLEGITWNANEQSKEGRRKNQEALYKKRIQKQAEEELSFEEAKRLAQLAP